MPISALAFRNSLAKCFDNSVPSKILLALSGGADSMCLAHLLSQYKRESHPSLQIHALTIDHGYRDESAAEAMKVGQLVTPWGITHHVRKLSYPKNVHDISNFEEVARNLRYLSLQELAVENDISAVLVGHNCDDRLETFLQRLQMNSTLYGLNALAPRAPMPITSQHKIGLYRPLLDFYKSSIRETCTVNNVPWFEDASNQDVHLTKRNLLRYMISEYVPVHRPEVQCLTKEQLKNTTDQVSKTVEYFNSCKQQLSRSVEMSLDQEECKLKVFVPTAHLLQFPQESVARWLYDTARPFSSAKHFHWSYAKIERKAVPRMWKFLQSSDHRLKMTYLNVVFEITKEGENLVLRLSKQPPLREELNRTVPIGSDWVDFDTWRIKITPPSNPHRVIYYQPTMKKRLLATFPQLKSKNRGKLGPVPVVLDGDNEIVAVPTYGLTREGTVECVLKNWPRNTEDDVSR